MLSTEPLVAAAFMIVSFVLGVSWFSILIPLIAGGIGSLLTLVGIPLLLLAYLIWTAAAGIERWRTRAFFGVHLRSPYRPLPPEGTLDKIKTRATDPATWKDLAFILLLFPIGIVEFSLTVALLSATFSSLLMPVYFWAIPGTDLEYRSGYIIDTWPEALAVGALGFVLLLITSATLIGLKRLHIATAEAFLGTPRHEAPSTPSVALSNSRSRLIDAVAERRQMESTREEDRPGQSEGVPEAPSDPTDDRGFEAAIPALAGNLSIPVAVDINVPRHLPAATETIAYLVVTEALANVATHSRASRARVIVRWEGGNDETLEAPETRETLVIEVADDGIGGVDPAKGSGLTRLRDRLVANDGKLLISSPFGGPTWIRAEVPCRPLVSS